MLRFEHVGKTYAALWRRTPAVRDFDLRVGPGEIVGLVGANGAGKTTLIHLALGFLWPTAGRVLVFERAPEDPDVRMVLGWVPDEPIYPRGATAAGLLERWLAGHGWSRARRRERIDELLEQFGMAHAARRRIHTYSLGMQQKASLMLALAHRPRLLILDEPFSALDHRAMLHVRQALDAFRRGGGAALVSSHHLSELESLCDRAVFLAAGTIQREEVLDGGGAARVRIELRDSAAARGALESAVPAGFDDWALRDGTLTGRIDDRERIPELVAFLVERGVGVRSVLEETSRLEEAFLDLERSL